MKQKFTFVLISAVFLLFACSCSASYDTRSSQSESSRSSSSYVPPIQPAPADTALSFTSFSLPVENFDSGSRDSLLEALCASNRLVVYTVNHRVSPNDRSTYYDTDRIVAFDYQDGQIVYQREIERGYCYRGQMNDQGDLLYVVSVREPNGSAYGSYEIYHDKLSTGTSQLIESGSSHPIPSSIPEIVAYEDGFLYTYVDVDSEATQSFGIRQWENDVVTPILHRTGPIAAYQNDTKLQLSPDQKTAGFLTFDEGRIQINWLNLETGQDGQYVLPEEYGFANFFIEDDAITLFDQDNSSYRPQSKVETISLENGTLLRSAPVDRDYMWVERVREDGYLAIDVLFDLFWLDTGEPLSPWALSIPADQLALLQNKQVRFVRIDDAHALIFFQYDNVVLAVGVPAL